MILAKNMRLTFKITSCKFVFSQILLAERLIRSYLTQLILSCCKLLLIALIIKLIFQNTVTFSYICVLKSELQCEFHLHSIISQSRHFRKHYHFKTFFFLLMLSFEGRFRFFLTESYLHLYFRFIISLQFLLAKFPIGFCLIAQEDFDSLFFKDIG